MGRAFADPLINDDKAHWQFDVIEGEKKMAVIRVQSSGESKTLAPEQIGSARACRRARGVRRACVCLFPDLASALSFASSFLFRCCVCSAMVLAELKGACVPCLREATRVDRTTAMLHSH